MHHSVFGKKLSRTKNERRRLLQGLARELIVHGSVKTTITKARAVRPLIEKLVTQAKSHTSGSLQALRGVLSDKDSERLILSDGATRFASRTSGFTRIIKLGTRRGDNAEEVMLQFVDSRVIAEVVPVVEKKKPATAKATAGKRGRPKKTK
ncbi:MAG: 50S ribosomal protein L17 [Patescibacteria group bacterium]